MSRSSSVVVNVDNAIAIKLVTYVSELLDKEAGATLLNECNDLASKNDITSIVSKLDANVGVVFEVENYSGECCFIIIYLIFITSLFLFCS